jgi:hypothetical protein
VLFALPENVPMDINQTSRDSRIRQGRPLLWVSFFLLLLLGAFWLGLNVIRVRTYDYAADYQRHLGDYRQSLYWYAVKLQSSIMWAATLDIVVCLGLAVTLILKRCRSISK